MTTKEKIIQKRVDVEKQINKIISLLSIGVSFNELKEMIYNEHGQSTLHEIIRKFDVGQDIDELNKIILVVNDFWNYYPHKVLGGLSPAEKILANK